MAFLVSQGAVDSEAIQGGERCSRPPYLYLCSLVTCWTKTKEWKEEGTEEDRKGKREEKRKDPYKYTKKQQTKTKNPEPWVTRGLQPGVRLCANVAIFTQTKYVLKFLFASLHTELHGTETMLESSRAHMPQKYNPTWRTSLAPVHESMRRMKVIWRGMSTLCASRLWHLLTQFTP